MLDLPHPWDGNLIAMVQHLNIVKDAQCHLLHNFPHSPPPRHNFPFSRSRNNNVSLRHTCCLLLKCLTCVNLVNLNAKSLFQLLSPFISDILANEIIRCNIQAFTAFRLLKLPVNSQFCTCKQICRCTDEHALIWLVKLLKRHRNNRVEFLYALLQQQLLNFVKLQISYLPRVHVLKLGWRKELVR